jgi:hypothetical protein
MLRVEKLPRSDALRFHFVLRAEMVTRAASRISSNPCVSSRIIVYLSAVIVQRSTQGDLMSVFSDCDIPHAVRATFVLSLATPLTDLPLSLLRLS